MSVAFISTFWLLTVTLAIVSACTLAFFAQKQVYAQKSPIIVMTFAYGFACTSLWPLLSGRKLSGYTPELTAELAQVSNSLWLLRGMNVLIIGGFCIAVLRRIVRIDNLDNLEVRWSIGLGLITYVGTNYFLNNLLGKYPILTFQPFYALCFLMSILIMMEGQLTSVVNWARSGLLIFCFASLALIPLLPDLVIQANYSHGIFPFRFWGLAMHANVMGPIAAIALIICLCLPFQKQLIDKIIKASLVCIVIITQSKTAILALIFSLFVAWLLRFGGSPSNKDTELDQIRLAISWRAALRIFMLLAILASVVAFIVVSILPDYEQHDSGALSALTNRDIIWKAALNEFFRNPAFGYGSSIFDADFRSLIRINSALNAHNQYIQVLASAGIVGLLGFVVYYFTLGFWSFKKRHELKGITAIIFLFLSFRSFTEVPYSLHTSVGIDLLVHAFLVAILIVSKSEIQFREGLHKPAAG